MSDYPSRLRACVQTLSTVLPSSSTLTPGTAVAERRKHRKRCAAGLSRGLHVAAMIVLLFCMTASPAFADTPGLGNTDIHIQNASLTRNNVFVDYYDLAETSYQLGAGYVLPTYGGIMFETNALPVGSPWGGFAGIASEWPIATLARTTWTSTYGSADDMNTSGAAAFTYRPSQYVYFPE